MISTPRRLVAYEQEKSQGHGPEEHELGVAARHAVALAVDAGGALLLDQALQQEVGRLAGELAGEEEQNLGLARRPDQGGVDDAQRLRNEGEPGANVRDGVGWVLWSRWG